MYYVITGVIVRGYEPPLILNSLLSSCNVQETHCTCTPVTNIAVENGPGLKMYFLLEMGIFQPATIYNVGKNTSCLVAALFGPGVASLCLLSPLDRGKPLRILPGGPDIPPNPAEYWRSDWHSGMFLGWCWSYLLILEQMCQINPYHFSSFMCPSETCWLFLSLSDHLQAMYHLYWSSHLTICFFTNIAFVYLQTILPYNHKRRWFERFFVFIPILGEMIQFDEHICSNGLVQPPTRP